MANFYTLKRAIMEAARADTGSGGLVELVGKDVPVKRDKSPDELDPPEVGFFVATAGQGAGVPDSWDGLVQFDVAVPQGTEGLEERIGDRVMEVLTYTNLKAHGVDVRTGRWTRRDLTALADGYRRIEMELPVAFTR